jgi:hypothetical protein
MKSAQYGGVFEIWKCRWTLYVCRHDGVVIFRAHNPDVGGDILPTIPSSPKVARGESISGTIVVPQRELEGRIRNSRIGRLSRYSTLPRAPFAKSRELDGMMIAAAAPVRDEKRMAR